MLKYYNFDIVCQEIPDEITLAINLTGCPNRCEGCHSPWLHEDVGESLTTKVLDEIICKYSSAITCVCFMGGDQCPNEVEKAAKHIASTWSGIKIGWYSGCDNIPNNLNVAAFNYMKIGSYNKVLGGLKSEHTNQRLYKVSADGYLERINI